MRVFRIALCATLAGWLVGVLAWIFLFPPGGWRPRSLAQVTDGLTMVAGAVGLALLPTYVLVVLPYALFLQTRSRPWHSLPSATVGAAGALAVLCVYACLVLPSREEMELASRSFGGELGAFVALLVGATIGGVTAWLTRLESHPGSRRIS